MIKLALLAGAAGLLLAAEDGRPEAPDAADFCGPILNQVSEVPADGFRLATLYPVPVMEAPDGSVTLPLYAGLWARPEDDRAAAFYAATSRMTHYLAKDEVAREMAACFKRDRAYRKLSAGSDRGDYRAEFVHRRSSVRVTVEASVAACQGAPAKAGQACARLTAWK